MEELKNQNSLLLQLVSGLQSQINSKNRQNQIMFQQYQQVSQENSALRAQIENSRNKLKQYQKHPSKKYIQQEDSKSTQKVEHQQLKNELKQRNRIIQKLKLDLEEKGGTIVLLQSQLIEAREQLINYTRLQKNQQDETSAKGEEANVLQQKIKELQESLQLKSNTVNQLTEYMQEQANKINQLTSESINTINNYENKLEQKDKQLEQIQRQLRQINEIKVKDQVQRQEENDNNEVVEGDPKAQEQEYGNNIRSESGQTRGNNLEQEKQQNASFGPELKQMLENKIKQLESMIALKEKSILELSEFLQTQSQKMAVLEQKIQERTCESLEQENARLSQLIVSKELLLTELGQFLTQMTAKCSQYDQKIQQMQVQHQILQQEWEKERDILLTKLQPEKSNEADKKQVSQQIKENEKQDLISSQEFFFQSEQQITEVRVKLSTKEDQVAHLKELLNEKDEQLKKTIKQKTTFFEEKSILQIKLAQMSAVVQNRELNLSEMREYLNEKVQKEISNSVQMPKHSQIKSEQKQNATLIEQLRQKIEDLQTIIKNKQQSYTEIAQSLAQCYKQIAVLEAQKTQMDTDICILKDLIKAKNDSSVNIHYEEEGSPSASEDPTSIMAKSIEIKNNPQDKSQLQEEINLNIEIIRELRNIIGKNRDEIQKLTGIIKDKQDAQNDYDSIIEGKAQTIAELSEYMNEQADRVAELEEQLLRYQRGQPPKDGRLYSSSLSDKASDKYETRISDLLGQLERLEQKIIEKGKIVEELQNKIQIKQLEIEELKSSQEISVDRKSESIKFKSQGTSKQNQIVQSAIKESKAKENATKYREEAKSLQEKIDDLEETINAKDNTIQELSQFMNDQATRLCQLEAIQDGNNNNNIEKQTLYKIIAEKQQTISNMALQFEDNNQAMAQLHQQIQNLRKKLEQKGRIQSVRTKTAEEVQIEQEGRNMVDELQTILTEKTAELETVGKKLQQAQNQVEGVLEHKNKLQKMLSVTQIDYYNMLEKKQHTIKHVEELETKAKELLERILDHRNEDDREDINAMTEVLQHLQEELRAKGQVIQDLEKQLQILRGGKQTPTSLLLPKSMKKEIGQGLKTQKEQKIKELEQQLKNSKIRQEELAAQLEKQKERFEREERFSLGEHELSDYQKRTKSVKHDYQDFRQGKKWLPSEQVSSQYFSQMSSGVGGEREQKLSTADLLSQLMMYSDDETNEKAIKVLVKALGEKYRQELNEYENQNVQLKDTMESLLEQNANLQAEMYRVSMEIKEKNEIIDQLEEINEQNTKSYQCKLQQIRQSISMFGDGVPSRVFEIISEKKQERKRQFRHTLDVEPGYQFGLPHKFKSKKQIRQTDQYSVKMVEEVSELKEQIQKLRDQGERRDKELTNLRKTNKSNQYTQQLQGLLGQDNIKPRKNEQDKIEELQNEKQHLLDKCHQLQQKLIAAITQCEQQDQLIETLNKRLAQKPTYIQVEVPAKAESSQAFNDTTTKILEEMENNKKPYRDSDIEPSQNHNQFPETPNSQEPIEIKLAEKQEIILELEDTILNMQKGYNHQIMGLRRNIAELDGQIISLRRQLYMADPNAIDVADLIKDTCSQNGKTAYYKPQYKSRIQPPINPSASNQNLSYYTEGRRSKRGERGQQYDQADLNLGEKMMGRPCRGNFPNNFRINNQFKLNHSGWDMGQMPNM